MNVDNNNVLADNIKIYPNPVSKFVTVSSEQLFSKAFNIEIIDNLGKKVFSENYSTQNNVSINLEQFSKGIYFMKFSTNEKQRVQKLIVN